MSTRLPRVFAALAREGLHLTTTDHGYRVRKADDASDLPAAELLLPPELPLDQSEPPPYVPPSPPPPR